MASVQSSELQRRFDPKTVDLITTAYSDVLFIGSRRSPFGRDDRMAVAQALMNAAEQGHTDLERLKAIARRELEIRGWRGLKCGGPRDHEEEAAPKP